MIEIQYLGQNGFRVMLESVTMYFDLYLSDCVHELTGAGVRSYEAPISAESIVDADYYFISHEHLDHLDSQTVWKVAEASPQAVFVCPYPHRGILMDMGIPRERVIAARAHEKIVLKTKIGEIEVIPIPEKHEEYTIVDGCHGTLGYIVRKGDMQFYHAGDCIADQVLAEDLKRYGRMNIMFVPINGHDWKRFCRDIMGNMDYREALDLCDYVGTDLVVPMHYDLFGDNTDNPAYFVDYLYREYSGQKFKMFMPGETLLYRY